MTCLEYSYTDIQGKITKKYDFRKYFIKACMQKLLPQDTEDRPQKQHSKADTQIQ